VLGLFIWGYIFFIKGCCCYVQSKGYSSKWGLLGLFSVFGLAILLLISDKKNKFLLSPTPDQDLGNKPFSGINIVELSLSLLIATPALSGLLIVIFCLLNNLDYSSLLKNLSFSISLGIVGLFWWTAILLQSLKIEKISLNSIINYTNTINLKLIVFIAVVKFAFSTGFNSLTLYNLTFLFPSYVERYLNERSFNNVSDLLLLSALAILFSPAIEELFCRGIILQKWSAKWGVKAGIVTSSLLFALYHFRFDVIPLFTAGVLYSILYLKTRTLLSSTLCHSFYNTINTIFTAVEFFSKSATERETFISVNDYQALIHPLLGQRVLLVALTAHLIVYFIYKNFPKDDAFLPYYDSES
jgi:uncharacterized protein